MTIKVFLIDDQDITGKFSHFDAFLCYLNETFAPVSFTKGLMQFRGSEMPHTSFLATDSNQLSSVLKDPSALLLLDVTMKDQTFVQSATKLLVAYPERAQRASEISSILENGDPSDNTKLAGAILAIAEATLTRVAWVSTETLGSVTANLSSLNVLWIPWSPRSWRNHATLRKDLQKILEKRYMDDVVRLRKVWLAMADSTRENGWLVGGNTSSNLFPEGTYHRIGAHLNEPATVEANDAKLIAATCGFADEKGTCYLGSAQERLSVLRTTIRTNQIPLFLAQRLLGLTETSDLSKALSWIDPFGRDAAAVCWGLHLIRASTPASIELIVNKHDVVLAIRVKGNPQRIINIETALNLGAVRRSAIEGRGGNPGELTLGVDLLAPTTRHTSPEEGVVIRKTFTIEEL